MKIAIVTDSVADVPQILVEKYNIKDLELSRGEKKKNKFIIKKDNTLKSLREIEFFLGNWRRVFKGIKLYKILK